MTTVLDTPEQIEMFRYKTLLRGLRLETQGLQMSRGRSCYSIIKQEFGLKGSKQKVFDQFKLMFQAISFNLYNKSTSLKYLNENK